MQINEGTQIIIILRKDKTVLCNPETDEEIIINPDNIEIEYDHLGKMVFTNLNDLISRDAELKNHAG